MKKLFIKNKRFLRKVMFQTFPMTCAAFILFGVSILNRTWPEQDMTGYPAWLGYIAAYGGFVILILFTIDAIIVPLFMSVKRKPQKTLAERIRETEQTRSS